MRTQTIEQTIYSYSDLLLPENESLKDKVLSKLCNINIDYDWWEFTVEDFKTEIAPKFGFEVDKVYFNGFYSQGDGAMFEGRVVDFSKFISDKRINKLLEKGFVGLDMEFNHYGKYSHERSYNNSFDYWFKDRQNCENIETYFVDIVENEIKQRYESICKDLYRNLEKEYEYLRSEEAILESIESNEYEFDENGNIF